MSTLQKSALLVCVLLAAVTGMAARASSVGFVRTGNKVVCGSARFDVLSQSAIRMQYSASGFVDSPSAVVINRRMEDRDFSVKSDGRCVRISTKRMTLSYSGGEFTPGTLRVEWNDKSGRRKWTPGQKDDRNLGGPFGSFNDIIEQTRPENKMPEFPDGMLSRNGYYLLDDSKTPIWDTKSSWITPRKGQSGQDWYFFVYGTDYAGFAEDFTTLAGKIPMIPRYTLGAWVTDLNFEYVGQKIDEKYLDSILNRFRSEGIPIDVLVLDFAWHKFGWSGGLDWSPIISDPTSYMKKLHSEGIHVTVNDHPGLGLFYPDSHLAKISKALGRSVAADKMSDISTDWAFKTDPNDKGKSEGWYDAAYDDSSWTRMQTATDWENVGFKGYDGFGWYRKWVTIPQEFWNGPIHVDFMGVDDEYDLYVNGRYVTHHGGPGNSMWSTLTDTDISSFVKKDGTNLICVRVLDVADYGGISRTPIAICNARLQDSSTPFNLATKDESKAYMDVHNDLLDQGIDFWWIDGHYAPMQGLDEQMWTNKIYYDTQEEHTGKRSFIFSRYGGPGSHRYPGLFTGDCYSNWKTLACEIPYTIKAGNTLCPYVTHDISGFIGTLRDDFELYARWVQFGSLSPMLRLHSAHENPTEGNVRLPWNYGKQGTDLARKFFKLRYSLIPYMYTYTRQAYDKGLPIVRPLYLSEPGVGSSYRFDEYLLGEDLLVAPITAPGNKGIAAREIYLPSGTWVDYFTGKQYEGKRTIRYECPLENMPLFVRLGSIIPMQPEMLYSSQKPVDPLILDVYPGGSSTFSLYEDDGLSLGYRKGEFAWTRLSLEENRKNPGYSITIGGTKGVYKGQPKSRAYLVRCHSLLKPAGILVDGKSVGGWQWDQRNHLATIRLSSGSIRTSQQITVLYDRMESR